MKACIGCLVDGHGHTCGYRRNRYSPGLWKLAVLEAIAIGQTTGKKQRVRRQHEWYSWVWITEEVK
jgi:hypothetical protein